jgi:hypothetical protein
MKVLTHNDVAQNSVKYADDVVKMVRTSTNHTFAPASKKMRIVLNWYFDFADVTREELCKMASEFLIIKKRTEFKNIESREILEKATKQEFSVRSILDEETRKPADNVSKAKDLLSKLTPEQLAAATGLPLEMFQNK